MSSTTSRPVLPCAWCGLFSEAGPVCDICGSPVVDITGWTTVLTVTWPLESLPSPPVQGADVTDGSVALEQAPADLPLLLASVRSWLEKSGEAEEPTVLSIDRSNIIPVQAPALPTPAHVIWTPVAVPAFRADPRPGQTPFRLGATWSFQPTEEERRAIRLETLRSRGAAALAIGAASAGFVYLVDRALR